MSKQKLGTCIICYFGIIVSLSSIWRFNTNYFKDGFL